MLEKNIGAGRHLLQRVESRLRRGHLLAPQRGPRVELLRERSAVLEELADVLVRVRNIGRRLASQFKFWVAVMLNSGICIQISKFRFIRR